MKKISLFIVAWIVFTGYSCTSYLDVKDRGEVIPETAEEFSALMHTQLNSIDQASDYVIFGNYASALSYESYADNLDADLSLSSDLAFYVGADIGSLSGRYRSLYEVIRNCNIVLDNLKERDTELGMKLVAVAYTLRGVCYYNLMRNFCEPYDKTKASEMNGVPLVERVDMEATPGRADLQATVDFIVGDLKRAIELKQTDKHYRFDMDVAKAYLARTYFWAQDWALAASTAKGVLEAYPLLRGEAYQAMVKSEVKQSGNELLRAGVAKSESYTLINYRDSRSRPLSLEFVKLFEEKEKDVRYALSFDDQLLNVKTLKMALRGDEMCLVMAESYAHLDDTKNALIYLNLLREHRITEYVPYTEQNLPAVNPDALIKVDVTGKTLTPLMSAILNERRKEFYMEGDRWFELKRNGHPAFWWGYNGVKYETAEFLYTFPIPKADIVLNSKLVQNPEYDKY